MELQNFIFHELETVQGQRKVTIKERDEAFPLPSDKADNFIDKAIRSFKKDRGRAYARFGHGWLPDRLAELQNQETSFYDFSVHGLKELRFRLEQQVATTGGHLFFIHYTDEDLPYFMALLLKDLEGFVISDQNLEQSHILNLEKLHFAAMVEINRWLDVNDDGAYITFLKGAGRSEISHYFKTFLCIDEESFIDPKKNTLALVDAINDYCHAYFTGDDIKAARHRAKNEILRCINNDSEITLERIGHSIDPDLPERFNEYLVAQKYEIQPEFNAEKSYLKKLTVFSGSAKGIRISFDYEKLNNQIEFQDGEGDKAKLIIKEIPLNLLTELRMAQNSENED